MSGRFGSQLNGLRAGATAAGAAIPAAEAAIACYRLLSQPLVLLLGLAYRSPRVKPRSLRLSK